MVSVGVLCVQHGRKETEPPPHRALSPQAQAPCTETSCGLFNLAPSSASRLLFPRGNIPLPTFLPSPPATPCALHPPHDGCTRTALPVGPWLAASPGRKQLNKPTGEPHHEGRRTVQ